MRFLVLLFVGMMTSASAFTFAPLLRIGNNNNKQVVGLLSNYYYKQQQQPQTFSSKSNKLQAKGDENDESIGATSSTSSRRGFLVTSSMAVIATAITTTTTTPMAAHADVSDGNALPQGAAQFSRVIRAKADLQTIAKRVKKSGDDMDKAEWNNVGGFLRKLYSVSDDMKAMTTGMDDAAKTKRGLELVDQLKTFAKAADAPTGSQNGPEFLQYAQKLLQILDEFLDLLRDVPDEL